MTIQQILTFLSAKGLLHEDEAFTIADGEEAASISLTLPHLLILKDVTEEEKAILSSRLSMLYEKESALILLSSEGRIRRLTMDEFRHDLGKEPFLFLFDSRKARVKGPAPFTLSPLEETMDMLLSPGGCPWDRAQDHRSLRTYFLQEVYEVIDAIDKDDMVNLKEELGDVLMQVAFHAVIEEERGRFTFEDVCREVCEKLVFRHPNIFASSAAQNAGINGWDALKNKEKGRTTLADELATVPATLPALMRAQKLQKRAAGHGLGQQDAAAAQHRLEAAVQAFGKAEDTAKQEAAGQLLFAAVNAARLAGVDAEEALTFASKRFAQQCLEQEQSGTQVE